MNRGDKQARGVVGALLRHPSLWWEAVRAAAAVTPRRWWRRAPFLPLPDRRYVAWRVATAYGRSDAPVAAADVVHYLRWRALQRRM